MKEKPSKEEKEVQESSGLKTAGAEGEITAGMHAGGLVFINWVLTFSRNIYFISL